jgi:ribosomal subunit interface protein
MKVPLQITFRNVAQSDLIESYVRERAESLDKFADWIIGCRVVIESPHRRHRQGQIFHVRVEVAVPGEDINIHRDPAAKHAHEDVFVAIRDAFAAARRRLQDAARRRRGDVKRHVVPTGTPSRR